MSKGMFMCIAETVQWLAGVTRLTNNASCMLAAFTHIVSVAVESADAVLPA